MPRRMRTTLGGMLSRFKRLLVQAGERKERRSAGIYLRSGKFFVYPYYRTTAGVLIASGPVTVLPDTAEAGELGRAILLSLQEYKNNLPHPQPSELDSLPEPILETAGVKSWSTFSKGALACLISSSQTELTFKPSRREGSRGAYLDSPELAIDLTLPTTPEKAGIAAREALSRCE